MTGLEAIRQEMAYTTFEDSCGDSHVTPEGELRQCRRTRGHDSYTRHASDFPLVLW